MSRRLSATTEAWLRWHPSGTSSDLWVRAVTSALHGPRDPLMRLVLVMLAMQMRRRDIHARATHAQLAGMTGLAERTVRDRLSRALEAGWLIVHGPRTRRAYELTTPARLSAIRHPVPERSGMPCRTPRAPPPSRYLRGSGGHERRHPHRSALGRAANRPR